MEHKGTVELQTERLILRRITEQDVPFAFKNWCNDERVTKFLTWQPHGNIDVTQAVLREWIKEYSRSNFYQWAIVPKDLGEVIGTISVVRVNDEKEQLDMGYCIGYEWWHKGYTSEALKRVIDFLFAEVKPQKIVACHATENPNSGKVMQKAGMQYERTMIGAGHCNKGQIDVVVYSIEK
ncbi:MAG: GNAT family N-acetyltransferase [Clostridia bacterium]|nr:GNAT family N-acetyltransferase [Clostridia bacterium]